MLQEAVLSVGMCKAQPVEYKSIREKLPVTGSQYFQVAKNTAKRSLKICIGMRKKDQNEA